MICQRWTVVPSYVMRWTNRNRAVVLGSNQHHHRWFHRRSSLYIPTLKQVSNEVAVLPSHQLLLRAGYIRRASNGIYMLLPLAVRCLEKLEILIGKEMSAIQCSKMMMPSILTKELLEKTGRWEHTELFRLVDRRQASFSLAPTHEEIFTQLAQMTIHSHNQLPLSLYQIGRKFRDEIRPRFGLLRSKEFVMKDAYSFDLTAEAARVHYETFVKAYHRIFSQLQLPYRQVRANAGPMGGTSSHEFHLLSPNGSDDILACTSCSYAANHEVATSNIVPKVELEKDCDWTLGELVQNQSKTGLACQGFHSVGDPDVVILSIVAKRRVVNVTAVETHFNNAALIALQNPNITDNVHVLLDGASLGSKSCESISSHLQNLMPQAKIDTSIPQLAQAQAGDGCPECHTSSLVKESGFEVGHVFHLGDHYAQHLSATVVNRDQKSKYLQMGCYGIGCTRVLAASVECSHDDRGIVWPEAIAPYLLVMITSGTTSDTCPNAQVAVEIVTDLETTVTKFKDEIVLDDRWTTSFGKKLTEAELIGYSYVVIVGKGYSERGGQIELIERRTRTTHVFSGVDELVEFLSH